MIAIAAGFALALGATFWVLRPVLAGVPAPAVAPHDCAACGARPPELDAAYCSNCGAALPR